MVLEYAFVGAIFITPIMVCMVGTIIEHLKNKKKGL